MTERLKQLLDGEAHDLAVPPPTTDAVLRQGRAIRRRKRIVVGACGAAAAVIVGGGVVALAGGDTDRSAPDATSAAESAAAEGAVYAIGNEVYVAGGARSTTIPDKAVKSLYYTSAGVLVRHGNNSSSDGGGPQRFSLVRDDGSLSTVSVETEETVHATDPDEPYLVYGQAVDGELVVFVRDVSTDEEVARIPVAATSDSWFPVSLDGDRVIVQNGYGNTTYAVDWRSGEVAESDVVDHGIGVAGGHTVVTRDGGSVVVDVATGDEVLDLPGDGWASLSPDGRFVQVTSEDYSGEEPRETLVYDLAAGTRVSVSSPWGWGWTRDGDLFAVDADKRVLTTCDPSTGDCAETQVDLPPVPEEVCRTRTTKRAVESWCEGGTLEVIYGGRIRES